MPTAVPKWPYWYPVADDGSLMEASDLSDPSAANWTGFLRPILDSVCEAAALECELVFYTELTDRIPLLQNVSTWLQQSRKRGMCVAAACHMCQGGACHCKELPAVIGPLPPTSPLCAGERRPHC